MPRSRTGLRLSAFVAVACVIAFAPRSSAQDPEPRKPATPSEKTAESKKKAAQEKKTTKRMIAATPIMSMGGGMRPARPIMKTEVGKRSIAILDEFDTKMRAFQKGYRELAGQGREKQIEFAQKNYPQASDYVARMWNVVKTEPANPEAYKGLEWTIENAKKIKRRSEALDHVLKHHLTDKRLGDLCAAVTGLGRADGSKALETIAVKSPHRPVQARALYSLAELHRRSAPAKAEAIYERLIKDYAGVKGRGRKTIDQVAAGTLREMRHLGIGRPAPEISGEDIDGVQFKLSDYRGKVILLDFWGDW